MSNTTTTTETLTASMVEAMRSEAAAAGDSSMAVICDMALEREDPTPTGDMFEHRFGGGGFDESETAAIMAIASVQDARDACALAITEARAMDDDQAFVRVVG